MAVDVPQTQLRSIEAAVAQLKPLLPAARWTKPEVWHLTLKFFGEVAAERVPELIDAIGRATRGFEPVESALEELGAFPNARRARVLWAGVADPETKLGLLAERICSESGFPLEERFTPHLTLARFKVPLPVAGVIDVFGPAPWDRSVFVIDKAKLIHSVLGGGGPQYSTLAEFTFPQPQA